jgi:hypothetical protein
VRLVLSRHVTQSEPPLVQHEELRQPQQGAQLLPPLGYEAQAGLAAKGLATQEPLK